MEGVIMSRALLKWQWRDEPNLVVLWTYLLIHAAHDIAEYRGVTVARGQVATCRNKLASETGLNEHYVGLPKGGASPSKPRSGAQSSPYETLNNIAALNANTVGHGEVD